MELLDVDRDYAATRSPSPRSVHSFADSTTALSSPGNFVRNEVMINFLRQRQLEKLWSDTNISEGVILKRSKGDFICQPPELAQQVDGYFDQVKRLNVKSCMTIKTAVIQTFLKSSDLPFVPLSDGLRLQVLADLTYLSKCQKHHFAAFVNYPPMLVVWDDDPEHIIARGEAIQQQLVGMIWNSGGMKDNADYKTAAKSNFHSRAPTVMTKEVIEDIAFDSERHFSDQPRSTRLFQPILIGVAAILAMGTIGIGWRKIVIELGVDHDWLRLVFIVVVPAQLWLGWFFFQTLVNGIAQMFGPVNQIASNSKFFSGIRSPRLTSEELPHVTIQMPVYKEGLWSVIDPTIMSLKSAISTYEMQGGTANIFVNDDGLQIIPDSESRERREYYEEHNIGWVARPKHNPKGANGEKSFTRAGKFKKASNMNYAMSVSARVEDKLARVRRPDGWSQEDEDEVYNIALSHTIEEDQGRTWAEGNIRIGDYILIIDSDTRVPQDCFFDAVSEMELSPQVAIIQFSSGVMNVTASFFEKGITFFTNLVYTAIQFAVANGDVAPFVGHNAILRWSALQDIAYPSTDGSGIAVEKYWAETTVSEDFDMALRLQALGYSLRFASYYGRGFKEGVSLTVYDELSRWEKYAYGCSELIFNPFRYWFNKGPVTPLFRSFIFSKMSIMAKITIMSYIGTYYAIGSAWILTLLNYFLIGWFNGYLDHYYVDSFKIYFSIVIVFQALGTVALAVLRYRIEGRSLIGCFLENLTWLPLLTVFLGGVSMHVSQAIVCHMFSVDMSWGATSKEAENTTFFAEVPKILQKFKFTFAFCLIMITAMIVLAGVGPVGSLVPYDWQITTFTAIWPLSTVVAFHFLLPLVLNPGLMQFTF